MTNLEHFAEMTPQDAWDEIMWLLHIYGARYNHTELAVIEWFGKEYTGEDE